jgi:hypothetical protein
MIDWVKGEPERPVILALVIYKEDYEFGRWNGQCWNICVDSGSGGHVWAIAEEPIEFYAFLNKPDKDQHE